jgi:hypothetical protein
MANQNPVPLVNIKIAAPKISKNHGKSPKIMGNDRCSSPKRYGKTIGFDSPNHRCLQFNLICKDLPGRAGLAVKGIPAISLLKMVIES